MPLHLSLSCSFEPEHACKQKESSPTSPLSFLSDFLWDSSEIVARAKIGVSKLPFHLLSTTPLSSWWIQVYYSWSFKLLDG
jgi:hypothetical protein